MTKIELGSPSISQKKHIIGYWVFDNENVKLDCFEIQTSSAKFRYAPETVWYETGSFYGSSFYFWLKTEPNPSGGWLYSYGYRIAGFPEMGGMPKVVPSISSELDITIYLMGGENTFKIHRIH